MMYLNRAFPLVLFVSFLKICLLEPSQTLATVVDGSIMASDRPAVLEGVPVAFAATARQRLRDNVLDSQSARVSKREMPDVFGAWRGPSDDEIFSDDFETGDVSRWSDAIGVSDPGFSAFRTFPSSNIQCSEVIARLDAVTGNASGFSAIGSSQVLAANDGSWLYRALVGDCSPMSNTPSRAYSLVPIDNSGTIIREFWRVEVLPTGNVSQWSEPLSVSASGFSAFRAFSTSNIQCSEVVARLDAVTGNVSGFSAVGSSQVLAANDGSWLYRALVGDCSPMSNAPTRAYSLVPIESSGTIVREFWRVEVLP